MKLVKLVNKTFNFTPDKDAKDVWICAIQHKKELVFLFLAYFIVKRYFKDHNCSQFSNFTSFSRVYLFLNLVDKFLCG